MPEMVSAFWEQGKFQAESGGMDVGVETESTHLNAPR